MANIMRNSLRLVAAARTINSAASSSILTKTSFTPVQQQKRTMSVLSFGEKYYNLRGYNQYGLLEDDILNETDIVKEALKRMPPAEYDERCFRICRALQLTINQTVLPKDEWTPFDIDKKKGKYLQPYIAMVKSENKEKEDWYKQ